MEEFYGLLLLVLLVVVALRAARTTTALNQVRDQMAALGQRLDEVQRSLDALRQAPAAPPVPTPVAAQPQPEPVPPDLVQDERGAWVPRDVLYPPAPEPEPAPILARADVPPDQIVGWDHGEPLYADEPLQPEPSIAARAMPEGADRESEPQAPTSPEPQQPPPPPSPRPVPKRDFELSFGRRWTVLIGGGSIALGSILLVRYSITQGLFPPELRLLAAALFSAAMMAGAEFLRRRRVFGPSRLRALPDIPSTLFGAGAAGLFATLYAAHVVYGFIGPGTAFGGMAAVAIAGIVVSLSYGPPLGVLGFAAAQAVPLLVGGGEPSLILPLYVSAVGAAAFIVANRGGWPWMEALAALGLLIWTVALHDQYPAYSQIVTLVVTLGAVAATARRLPATARGADAWGTSSLGLALLAAMVVLMPTPAGIDWLGVTLGLAAQLGVLGLASLRAGVPVAGVLAGAALALSLSNLAQYVQAHELYGWSGPEVIAAGRTGVSLGFALTTAAVLGLAGLALGRLAPRAPRAAVWAVCGQVLALAGGAFALDLGGQPAGATATIAAVGALGLLAIAWPRQGPPAPERELPVVLAATGALALLGLVPTILFSGPTLTLALALVMLAAAGLAVLWQVASLVPVAAAAGLAILAHAAWQTVLDLSADRAASGADLIALMLNSAVPGLLAAGAVLLLRQRLGLERLTEGDARWRAWLRLFPASGAGAAPPLSLIVMTSSASLLLLGGLGLAIRWIVFGNAYAPVQAPTDIGTLAAFVLGAALTALRLDAAVQHRHLAQAAHALTFAGTALVILAAILNPFVSSAHVGAWPILNLMLPAYLVPALIAAAIAWRARDREPLAAAAGGSAVLGGFAWLSLAVTQAYQGAWVAFEAVGETELWTYTLVWLAYGLGLLMLGLRQRLRPLRLVAFAVMIGVTLKAFLIDMDNLTGVARALSFMALGLVLLGIGMFYQRVMARQDDARDE
ncbi:DUF2339 domain-containing protein [Zavarzinia sp. CC-PAN008]|uniref:DUF2339 domain-containing protein n=1 Tax=Zavarzinia sp. CC-PAN008 TaxID=3243332 RepID=UPI003F7475DA